MDEVCRRAVILPQPRRFVCLTFDGGYKDVICAVNPILSRHGVPFTVYVPTAFPDGVGRAWWLALEKITSQVNPFFHVTNQLFCFRCFQRRLERELFL